MLSAFGLYKMPKDNENNNTGGGQKPSGKINLLEYNILQFTPGYTLLTVVYQEEIFLLSLRCIMIGNKFCNIQLRTHNNVRRRK